MELLLNEVSIHEQFHDIAEFREAVGRIVNMRNIARRLGRELYCNGNIVHCMISPNMSIRQGMQAFTRDQQSDLLNWLTKRGPFWDEVRIHGPDNYLECNGGVVVTDTAIGEAAYCSSVGIDRRLVSFRPSDWEHSPLAVRMLDNGSTDIQVANYWNQSELETALQEAEPPISSWGQLERVSKARFQRLWFSTDSFRPLMDGGTFVPGAVHKILRCLDVLDRFVGEIGTDGRRTSEGNRILQNHFQGSESLFSDSSFSEKNEYREQLTFQHPEAPGQALFCPWHGKAHYGNTYPYRIHFNWPLERERGPLYVVYIGMKITRR